MGINKFDTYSLMNLEGYKRYIDDCTLHLENIGDHKHTFRVNSILVRLLLYFPKCEENVPDRLINLLEQSSYLSLKFMLSNTVPDSFKEKYKERLEKSIKLDPFQSFYYSRDRLNNRFPEAEVVMLKHPMVSRAYLEFLQKLKI